MSENPEMMQPPAQASQEELKEPRGFRGRSFGGPGFWGHGYGWMNGAPPEDCPFFHKCKKQKKDEPPSEDSSDSPVDLQKIDPEEFKEFRRWKKWHKKNMRRMGFPPHPCGFGFPPHGHPKFCRKMFKRMCCAPPPPPPGFGMPMHPNYPYQMPPFQFPPPPPYWQMPYGNQAWC